MPAEQLLGPAAGRASPVRPPKFSVPGVFRAYLSLEWQARVVGTVAVLAMIYVQAVQPLYWGKGDPLDYYRMARFFLHLPGGLYVPWRPPGMALFNIITGVAWLDTFKISIAAYAAMSAAMPILIYGVLRRYSATWGMVAALIAVVGAIPYAHSRIAWPEELFFFLHFCALALIAAYFARPRNPRLPYAICATVFALNLVRPVAALYYWIFVLCAVLLVRRPLRHVLLATAVYVGLMGGWALADRYYGGSIFPTVYAPETLAQRLFGEVYFSGGPYEFVPERPPVAAIRPGDGPASRGVYDTLRLVTAGYPDLWRLPTSERPYLLFARFAGHHEDLVQAVMRKPNFAYFDFLRHALRARYGEGMGAERVMYRVAVEHENAGMRGLARYFAHNPAKLLVGGTPSFGGRNLLALFTRLRERKEMNRIYSVTATAGRALDLIDPANGASSKEFHGAVALFSRAYPGYWEQTNEWLGRYRGNPEGLVQAIFHNDKPNTIGLYEGWYWESMIKYYGIGPADRLFSRVAVETMKARPYSAALFWDNVLHITLIRTIGDIKWRPRGIWAGNFDSIVGEMIYTTRINDLTGLAPRLGRELTPVIHADRYADAIGLAYAVMHSWAPLFVGAALMLFPFCLLGPARRLAIFLAVAYAYNVVTIAVFGVFSAPRYEDFFMLLPVMLACLGAHSAVQTFKQRSGLGPDVAAATPVGGAI